MPATARAPGTRRPSSASMPGSGSTAVTTVPGRRSSAPVSLPVPAARSTTCAGPVNGSSAHATASAGYSGRCSAYAAATGPNTRARAPSTTWTLARAGPAGQPTRIAAG